jgi:hypothetical protein
VTAIRGSMLFRVEGMHRVDTRVRRGYGSRRRGSVRRLGGDRDSGGRRRSGRVKLHQRKVFGDALKVQFACHRKVWVTL